MKVCSVNGCFKKYYAKGFCSKHYANNRKHGKPVVNRAKAIEFYEDENGCFICTSHNRNADGYPMIGINRKVWIMSRFVYTEMFGIIPKDLVIRHKCDNPNCINPEHLETGTIADNNLDSKKRGRNIKGSRHHATKFSEHDVKRIKSMLAIGLRGRDIAGEFEVHERVISDIKRGAKWKHVRI